MGRLKDVQLFFFFKIKSCFKNTPFSIIIFYVMKVVSFLSYAAVTFLSLTFNNCHCMLLFHSLAQVQPHHSRTNQQSTGKQGLVMQTGHLHHHGQVAQENMGHWRGHLSGHIIGSDTHIDSMRQKWMQVSVGWEQLVWVINTSTASSQLY